MLCYHCKCCLNLTLKYVLINFISSSLHSFPSHCMEQDLHIESIGFLMFLSIIAAFYDTVNLIQRVKYLSFAFAECKHTKYKPLRSSIRISTSTSTQALTSNRATEWGQWTSAWTRASSMTMQRASLVKKDFFATLWAVQATPCPFHTATFTLQHSFIPAHLYSNFFSVSHLAVGKSGQRSNDTPNYLFWSVSFLSTQPFHSNYTDILRH